MARLFIALWPDAALRVRLAAHRDRCRWPAGARPVADGHLHLTLHFLGSVAADRVGALGAALAMIPMPSVALVAGQTEIWKGGIAVLRWHDARALSLLHERLGHALAGLGIALDDRPFAPHVTLARRANGAAMPVEPAAIEWRAETFALVASTGGAQTAYHVLRAWPG